MAQRQTDIKNLSRKLARVKRLYTCLRQHALKQLDEIYRLRELVPEWKPFQGLVLMNETSIDETIGKLAAPGSAVGTTTNLQAYNISLPESSNDSQNNRTQVAPEEPSQSPKKPPLPPAEAPAEPAESPAEPSPVVVEPPLLPVASPFPWTKLPSPLREHLLE
ncbi:hypothetical protein MMC34_007402 [Xylographa carneopallida]|nr:hypothetical protein [Xylographa carneopallida]